MKKTIEDLITEASFNDLMDAVSDIDEARAVAKFEKPEEEEVKIKKDTILDIAHDKTVRPLMEALIKARSLLNPGRYLAFGPRDDEYKKLEVKVMHYDDYGKPTIFKSEFTVFDANNETRAEEFMISANEYIEEQINE